MKDPSKNAPVRLFIRPSDYADHGQRSITYSMIFCGIISWLTAILMIWTAGDWNVYITCMASHFQNHLYHALTFLAPEAYMSWWMGVTGSLYGGGIFCAIVMIGINFFVIVGTNSAGSRIVWSMARDRAFPWSEYLAYVNPRLAIPLRAIGFVVIIDLMLGMLFSRPRPGLSCLAY